MDPAQLLASFKQRLSQNFQDRLAMDRPVYSTPPPVESTPQNNECRLVEVHGHKIAAFTINHEEYICLPQAFEIFLKHLVGGLHTVYTKLKRLSITPLVCNVEQVRTLRGLGAIQPGVNRCKLITRRDFETLYQDCTTSSRPGRPPKRFLPPHFSPTPPILGATPPKMPKTSFEESLPTATIDEFKGDDDEASNKAGSDEEITTSPSAQAISTSAPALPGAQSGIYAKAQEALRAHYQHMGLLGAQNGTAAQNGVPPTSAPVNVGAAFGAAGAALGLPTPLMAAQMRGAENGIEAGKKENQNNAYPNCSPRSPSERATAARRVPEMLERLDEMISEPEESESILVLASKLATYAAENARKRNQEARAELEKLRELYENERRQRESAEKKLEQSAKSSRRLFRIIKNLRQSRGIAGAKNEESPSKFSRSSAEEVVDEDENYSPSCGGNLTIHSQVEFHKIQQPHVA
ncbi:Oidioi.mRNA.OKI2018_I69.chr1.g1959.t1.cds [Oikopleura dioica]|uniref:Oidioi.mRNA.OKI2018_I69.chr1.g1959.t1.cds n=1 Tax=Oikopleura dioica TaxID=34765 RepID=A0ABN7ST22_OIKDI|nr:Oidioi.mRNA.OKI2018_I69.chr1.g1959.t1.cds [Oikopleura dioica]